jgi:hypothetical protein
MASPGWGHLAPGCKGLLTSRWQRDTRDIRLTWRRVVEVPKENWSFGNGEVQYVTPTRRMLATILRNCSNYQALLDGWTFCC